MRFALLLLLVGCAGNQSAFPMPPAAPTFSPTLDAPITVGQPGYAGSPENMPRSPHKRVLPETPATRKEAGIWASDSGSRHGPPYPQIHLLGIVWETLDNPTEHEWDTTAMCAVTMRLVGGDDMSMLATLADWPRACAIAKLYRHCADGTMREAQRKRARGEEYDVVAIESFKRVNKAAQLQEARSCKTEPTAETMAAIKAIAARWTATHETLSQ
jgi:hypothetical protein